MRLYNSRTQTTEECSLEDRNASAARTKIMELLTNTQGEWTNSWNKPRLSYLLGLTYELDGNVSEAVKQYWQLWRDYPDSIYTMIVRHKLELAHQ